MIQTSLPHDNLHPNLPTLTMEEVGEPYWVRPAIGSLVKTHWEVLRVTPKVRWQLCAHMTADKQIHDGRAHYRSPCSIRAWWKVLKQLPTKMVRHWRGEI
jgi:hypothetical protein